MGSKGLHPHVPATSAVQPVVMDSDPDSEVRLPGFTSDSTSQNLKQVSLSVPQFLLHNDVYHTAVERVKYIIDINPSEKYMVHNKHSTNISCYYYLIRYWY